MFCAPCPLKGVQNPEHSPPSGGLGGMIGFRGGKKGK